MSDPSSIRILFEAATPHTPSAYGDQSRRVVQYLQSKGYDVMMRAVNHHGQPYEWGGIQILPSGTGQLAETADRVKQMRRYKRNVWILHFDYWVYPLSSLGELRSMGALVVPRLPLEHQPMSPVITERLALSHLALVESRFAEKEVRNVQGQTGCSPYYVPVSIHNDYKPYPKRDGIFRVLMVKNNIGSRANIPALLKSYAAFVRERGLTTDDTELVLWTQTNILQDINGETGHLLRYWCARLDISDFVRFPEQLGMELGAAPRDLAENVFSQASVHVNPCAGESVGVTTLEAAACGVPAACVDWAGGAEHTIPDLRLPVAHPYPIQIVGEWGLVDEFAITEMLNQLYDDPVLCRKLGTKCREHSEQFREPVVMPQWLKAMDTLEEMRRLRHLALWGDLAKEMVV